MDNIGSVAWLGHVYSEMKTRLVEDYSKFDNCHATEARQTIIFITESWIFIQLITMNIIYKIFERSYSWIDESIFPFRVIVLSGKRMYGSLLAVDGTKRELPDR